MGTDEIRRIFLDFFERRGHAIVPSSSLVPDDASVLLTTAGMQQFKPYFVGKADARRDFGSQNVASVQKSFRTSDIDEVGDDSHLTFFEMLGNFSFGYKPGLVRAGMAKGEPRSPKGGYFKKEAMGYAHEFITGALGLQIDYVSVFEGDGDVPADAESEEIWKDLGIKKIKKFGREDNFWGPTGSEGPCGPTTEIYIKNASGESVEIWNIVFNEYYCNTDKTLRKIETPGVDTGMGLERLAMIVQGKNNIFDTDELGKLMEKADIKDPKYENSDVNKRIVADHIRAIAFLVADGIRPSNKEAGYILRRIMRRVIAMDANGAELLDAVVELYGGFYNELDPEKIKSVFDGEFEKFTTTLKTGLRQIRRMGAIDAKGAFDLYQSYGLPYETIVDSAGAKADGLSREAFDEEFARHQEKSRAGAEKKFGGHGLVLSTGELKAKDDEELKKVTRLHSATHLLQAALRKVLGDGVRQMGSDITAERTRFDFSFARKVTPDELKKIEDTVNSAISENYEVKKEEMPFDDAKKSGALFFFKDKYPETVSVYSFEDKNGDVFSKELCGGPHVTHTKEIGKFTIIKEQASSAGIRRIRAIVNP